MSLNLIFIYIVLPITFLLHIINIIIIAVRKKLHKPSYYILVNLSASDVLLLIIALARFSYSVENVFLDVAHKWFATGSVFSTLAITMDRYIAVIHCLRYRAIVTGFRFAVFLVLVWVISFCLALFPVILASDPLSRKLYGNCILVPVYLISCVIMISVSLWIRNVRNKHENEIKKRNIYFGVEGQKLDILQRLKHSALDIIKLNIITAILLLNAELFRVLMIYYFDNKNKAINVIVVISSALYVVSNPIVYAISMSELKQQYTRIFRRKV